MTKRRKQRREIGLSKRGLSHETLEKRELLAVDLWGDRVETPAAAAVGASHPLPLGSNLVAEGESQQTPRLVGVNPNAAEIFSVDSVNEIEFSPTELTFRFDGGQELDETTLSGIQLFASGGDDSFDEGNEVRIEPGFLGLADNTQTVIARFDNALPDERYQIVISGEE